VNKYVQDNRLPATQERAIADYCQILLNRESEVIMREAIFETLESLQLVADRPLIKRSTKTVS
jgi:hypothetical protein